MSAIFDLTQNPFAILGVSPRSGTTEIADAKADRLFDSEYDEAALEVAHSELIVERKRLFHEVSWLADLAPNRARAIVAELPKVDSACAANVVPTEAQLSRVNVAADLLMRFPHARDLAQELLDGHNQIDWRSVRQTIDETRALSGFGLTKDDAWKRAQSDLIDRHAEALLATVTMTEDGPELLASMLAASPSAKIPTNGLLERTVTQYDRWSVPRLEQLSEQIDASLAALKAGTDTEVNLSRLENLLADWDRISQPVQLRDQAKGLDEPRSLRLFKHVREVAIWFANERDNNEAARRITAAFAAAFSELPTVAAMTAADLKTLNENITHAEALKALHPLEVAADGAIEKLSDAAKQIRAGGFAAGKHGVIGSLFAAFDGVREKVGMLPDANTPWLLVRSVALALHNDLKASDEARILIEAIIGTAPDQARGMLDEDLRTLRSVTLQDSFNRALERNDWRAARNMVAAMIEADPEQAGELLKVQSSLDGKLSSRNWKRIGWGIAAGFVFLIVINDNASKPTPSAAPAYSYDPSTEPASGSDTSEAPVTPPDAAPMDTTEQEPPMFNIEGLTLPQLRFCKFENARLDILKDLVTTAMASEYNAKVDNYNNRCGRFRYKESDMTQIDAEIAAKGPQIRAEATKLLSTWRALSMPEWAADPVVPSTASPQTQRPSPLDDLGLGTQSTPEDQTPAEAKPDDN